MFYTAVDHILPGHCPYSTDLLTMCYWVRDMFYLAPYHILLDHRQFATDLWSMGCFLPGREPSVTGP